MRIGEAAASRLVALTDAADAVAQNNLGVVLQRGGCSAEAERAFGRAVALDAGMTVARRNLRALPAEAAEAKVAILRARVRADATDVDAWRALVRHHAARGELAAAAGALARWDAADAGGIAPSVERARWALDTGQPEEALTAVARARAGAGAHARAGDVALFAMLDLLEARAAYQRGDAAGALAAVERVRAVTPDDAEAELLRSFVLGELGADEAAAASRSRASALDPVLTRLDPGVVLVGSDASSSVASAAERPMDHDAVAAPDSAAHAIAVATALRHKGYYDEALATLDGYAVARAAETGTAPSDRERATIAHATGIVHLARGDIVAAERVLTDAYESARRAGVPADAETVALAAARLLVGDATAADTLARGVAHSGAPPLARCAATIVRALVAWRRGDFPTARATLLDAAAEGRGLEHGVRAAVAADLALLLADAGAAAPAVSAGAAGVRLAPTDPGAHAAHGRALALVGEHAAARAAYERACALVPHDAAARYGLAFAAGACGDAAAARAELARAAALSPVVRFPTPRLLLVVDPPLLLPSDGSAVRVAVAESSRETARDQDATRMEFARDYAHVDARLASGEYERALAAADAAMARGAPRVDGLLRAGHALAGSGHVALALERYRAAAAVAPAESEPEVHVLRALYRLGRLGEVCERAQAAGRRWPAVPGFAAILARAAADRGAVDDSAAALSRCADARREHIAAGDPAAYWADVACAWEALGAWDAAAEAWAEASRAVPALPRPAIALARALERAGQADAADAILQTLAERTPDLPDLWRARAEVAIAKGELPAARAHLARVVDQDAGDVDALATIAAAYVDADRLDDARASALQALAIDAEHPLALAVYGDCAAASGDVPGARDAWRRALGVAPVGAGAARARAGLRRRATADGARHASDAGLPAANTRVGNAPPRAGR